MHDKKRPVLSWDRIGLAKKGKVKEKGYVDYYPDHNEDYGFSDY